MAKVIFDACVIIGHLDETDSVHSRAEAIAERIHANGDTLQVIDLALQEAFVQGVLAQLTWYQHLALLVKGPLWEQPA